MCAFAPAVDKDRGFQKGRCCDRELRGLLGGARQAPLPDHPGARAGRADRRSAGLGARGDGPRRGAVGHEAAMGRGRPHPRACRAGELLISPRPKAEAGTPTIHTRTSSCAGRRANGQDLIRPKDFVRHAFRDIARDVATEWLGPRSREDERLALEAEINRHAPTRLDRIIASQLPRTAACE